MSLLYELDNECVYPSDFFKAFYNLIGYNSSLPEDPEEQVDLEKGEGVPLIEVVIDPMIEEEPKVVKVVEPVDLDDKIARSKEMDQQFEEAYACLKRIAENNAEVLKKLSTLDSYIDSRLDSYVDSRLISYIDSRLVSYVDSYVDSRLGSYP